MNHPDQRYTAHTYHLDELRQQAAHRQMVATIARHRPAQAGALGAQAVALLASLRAWIVHFATAHLFRSPLS